MSKNIGQDLILETPTRIEPARIDAPDGDLPDLIAEVSAKAEGLGHALHPMTAANLAGLVRIMNSYYSNLIEGHITRPREIEKALAGEAGDDAHRDLRLEAAAHVRVQQQIDQQAVAGTLSDPAGFGLCAALPRWLCRRWPEGVGDGAEQVCIRAGGSERDPDAGGCFDDAGGDFEETHAQCGELGGGERGFFRDGLLYAPHQPVGSGVQDKAHLVCVGRSARGAVA